MEIIVYNNNELVFIGNLKRFFEDNDYDEFVIEMCEPLQTQDKVEFKVIGSGEWKIQKIS